MKDFDPTLNIHFLHCASAPRFSALDDFKAKTIEENSKVVLTTSENQKAWLETKGVFFNSLKETLVLTDKDGREWVCLKKYCDTGRKNLNKGKLLIWSWLYAYFVTPKQAALLSTCAERGLSVINHATANHHEIYTVYNREYPWSPSYKGLEEYAQIDVKIGSEEIGKALSATTDFLWEEEYDASQERPVTLNFPCAKIINNMSLSQKNEDGFYYDIEGRIAAFDTNLTQEMDGVVIRKDVLDSFLEKEDLRLIWLVDLEKEIHSTDYSTLASSDWEAVFIYEGSHISGEINRMPSET